MLLASFNILLETFKAALGSNQHALDIRLKLFGGDHADTAKSYHNLGSTQLNIYLETSKQH